MQAPPPQNASANPPWLAVAADIAPDAIVVSDADGLVVEWNAPAAELFGWTRAEAVGQALETLIAPEPQQATQPPGLGRLLAGGEARILKRRIETVARHRDGHVFPVELTVTQVELDRRRLFIGFIRDIAERKRHEDQLRRRATEAELLYRATALAAESGSFEDALRSCIDIVRRLTGWAVGHALVPDRDDQVLVSSGIWSAEDAALADAFRAVTRDMRFARGRGLPGRIWRSGEPLWVAAAPNAPRYPRAELGHALGIQSAFGFPIKVRGRVVAVLEFFTTEERAPDTDLILLARTIGEQIGRLVERREAEEQRQVLLNELAHRVKNTLAVVSAIANQTLRTSATPAAFAEAFQARLQALAHAHSLLAEARWERAELRAIIEGALAAHDPASARWTLRGDPISVPPKAAMALSLVFHELGTNAAKYGALSAAEGHVAVTWDEAEDRHLRIEWRESGGSPLDAAPATEGYGSTLIKLSVERDLGGTIALAYPREGLRCTIVIPIDPGTDEIGATEQPPPQPDGAPSNEQGRNAQ